MSAPKKQYVTACEENQWIICAISEVLDQIELGHYFRTALTHAMYQVSIHPTAINAMNEEQCIKVKYIGRRIASILKERYTYGHQGYVEQGKLYRQQAAEKQREYIQYIESRENDRRKTSKSGYKMRTRCGNWGILVGLSKAMDKEYRRRFENGGDEKNDEPISFSKEETISEARVYCDASYTAPVMGGYTAWSGVHRLEDNGYLRKNGAKYKLTPKGYALGRRLYEEYVINIENVRNKNEARISRKRKRNHNDALDEIHEPQRKRQRKNSLVTIGSSEMTVVDHLNETFDLSQPIRINVDGEEKQFYFYLNIDSRERVSANSKRIDIYEDLKHSNDPKIPVMNKALSCGDFVWLLVDAEDKENESKMKILPFIIERKTWHDLYLSIFKDGRYERQKFVMDWILTNINLSVRNIFLIEDRYDQNVPKSLQEKCIQKVVDLECADGFHTFETKTKKVTERTIVNWTYMIRNWIDGNYDLSLDGYLNEGNNRFDFNMLTSFDLFQKFNKKEMIDNIGEKRLKTIDALLKVPGCSEMDAVYITERYETVASLLRAYDDNVADPQLMLHKQIQVGQYWEFTRLLLRKGWVEKEEKLDEEVQEVLFELKNKHPVGNNHGGRRVSVRLSKAIYDAFVEENVVELDTDLVIDDD